MDSCAELNLTLLGWDGSSGRTFKGAARRKQNSGVILSGLGASADNEEHDSPLCLCFYLTPKRSIGKTDYVSNYKKRVFVMRLLIFLPIDH